MKGAGMLVGNFKFKSLKETNLDVAQAFLNPKRDHFKTQTNIYFYISSRATALNLFTCFSPVHTYFDCLNVFIPWAPSILYSAELSSCICKIHSICITCKPNFSISIIYVYFRHNKKKVTWWLEDMNFIFSCSNNILRKSAYYFYHSKIKFISSRRRVISSIYFGSEMI